MYCTIHYQLFIQLKILILSMFPVSQAWAVLLKFLLCGSLPKRELEPDEEGKVNSFQLQIKPTLVSPVSAFSLKSAYSLKSAEDTTNSQNRLVSLSVADIVWL